MSRRITLACPGDRPLTVVVPPAPGVVRTVRVARALGRECWCWAPVSARRPGSCPSTTATGRGKLTGTTTACRSATTTLPCRGAPPREGGSCLVRLTGKGSRGRPLRLQAHDWPFGPHHRGAARPFRVWWECVIAPPPFPPTKLSVGGSCWPLRPPRCASAGGRRCDRPETCSPRGWPGSTTGSRRLAGLPAGRAQPGELRAGWMVRAAMQRLAAAIAAPSTVALQVRTLRPAFGWAFEERLLAGHPLLGMRRPAQPEPRRDVPPDVVWELLRLPTASCSWRWPRRTCFAIGGSSRPVS